MFRKLAAAGLAALAVGAVVPPVPALADSEAEYAFVQFMHSRDIDDFYPGRKEMITAGMAVCTAMDDDRYTWQQATMSASPTEKTNPSGMSAGAILTFNVGPPNENTSLYSFGKSIEYLALTL